jgi:uncharacterized protein YbaR (Trm112 family)
VVRITNEELAQQCHDEQDRIDIINAEMADVDSRLGKLYDALETGEFKGGELASRIKALFEKKEQLQKAKAEAEEALKCQKIELADPTVVKEYVQDLKKLLEESSIVEQKVFLKSFVDRIEVDDSEMKVVYTIPIPPDNAPAETVGVLPFIHDGPLYGTRTKSNKSKLGTKSSFFRPTCSTKLRLRQSWYNRGMKRELMDILACPVCKGSLELSADEENETEIVTGSLYCQKCNVKYPIIDTIPNLLPPDQHD